MANYDIVAVAKQNLFTAQDELLTKDYPDSIVRHILRLRDLYNWYLANPESADKVFVSTDIDRHKVSRMSAYRDLRIIKTLLPAIGKNTREFHRWRYNEMILETYRMAKLRKDTKTMEKAASSYAKYNRVDVEDESAIPYDKIVVQPFTATSDPRVLGINPIPKLKEKIAKMLHKYMEETLDIQDVDFEEVDLEEEELFGEDDKEDKKGEYSDDEMREDFYGEGEQDIL